MTIIFLSTLRNVSELTLLCKGYLFLRRLLGITKPDKEKNQCIRQENWSTEHSKGNKTVPGKVATTCTENGHKQNTKTSTTE